jgi:salicylate hydroxylase
MRYLVRHGSMLNCVGLIKTDVHAQDGWSTPSTNQELTEQLAGWHTELHDLIHRIPEGALFKWPLLDRDPIFEWVDGRVALLGDAAHPMVPYYGIGAAIATEDGVILGRALAATGDPVEALKVYEQARVKRAAFAVLESRRVGEIYMGGNVLNVITKPLLDWEIYDYDPRSAPLQ